MRHRVDRDHGEPGVDQCLNQQPVAGLQHHPHLGRIRFQPQRALNQSANSSRSVVNTKVLGRPFLQRSQGDVMELFRPSIPIPSTCPPFAETMMLSGPGKRCIALMNQSSRDYTFLDVRPSPEPGRGAVSCQSSRDKHRKRSLPGSTV